MSIAIINHEDPWLVLASTSIIKGLSKRYPGERITFFVEQNSLPVLLFNKSVDTEVSTVSDKRFDVVINMTPKEDAASFASSICSGKIIGFTEKPGGVSCSTSGTEEYYRVMFENEKTDRHLLQVLYRLCDMTWKGEGYDLCYYPKNRTRKNCIGVSISRGGLREFVKRNLFKSMGDIHSVPERKNLFKRMDEINRCMYVVTDDLFTLHTAIALRKDVEFLDTIGLPYRIEFFGKGNYYGINNGEWKSKMQENESQESTFSSNP
jgi:hypothetical protein